MNLETLSWKTARIFLPLGLLGALVAPYGMSAESIKLNFIQSSYQVEASAANELRSLITKCKTDPRLVAVISEKLEGVKSTSLPYIVEKNRSLLIFQAFVKEGIDPARIVYETIGKENGNDQAMSVTLIEREYVPTKKFVPSEKNEIAGDKVFVLNFPSASAIPESFSSERLESFLASVGQSGRDAVLIEGYADTVGNAKYNQALGELRALSVYERLVRSGLPPYRVLTQSKGATAAKKKGDSAADRKVTVSWQVDAKLAEVAVVEDRKVQALPETTSQTVPAPAVVETKNTEPVPASRPQQSDLGTIDIVPFVGSLAPLGGYSNDAKAGIWYGIGLGKDLWTQTSSTVRANLSASGTRFEAKESALSGDVNATAVSIRLDYLFNLGVVSPFIGIGGGLLNWDGEIKEDSSGLKNDGNKSDAHAVAAVGMDIFLLNSLYLEPTIEWLSVGGDFNANLLGAKLALRWKL